MKKDEDDDDDESMMMTVNRNFFKTCECRSILVKWFSMNSLEKDYLEQSIVGLVVRKKLQ